MYQRVGQVAYKADLSNTLLLAAHLDHPEREFKSVHVAGTNGKGSTSHMLASILQEAGYKVGLYTSPHLKDFRERIKINGEMISEQAVINFVTNHRSFFETNQLSFFEMTVGMAFDYFRTENIDIAVIEVGMGGRLDSTNIVVPEVSVITNIGLDHTQFLGSTMAEIASEKAGIIKNEIPVVIGETQKETKEVFQKKALEKNAPIRFAALDTHSSFTSDLKGSYQKKNICTVLTTVGVLQELNWNISTHDIDRGLQRTVMNTGLQGRWQLLRDAPKVICDTAHNKEGIAMVLAQVRQEQYNTLHIVLGTTNDKSLDDLLALFPIEAVYYFCKADVPRGLDAAVLQEMATNHNLKGAHYQSVEKAYQAALACADTNDLVFVGGSTFVVAEVL